MLFKILQDLKKPVFALDIGADHSVVVGEFNFALVFASVRTFRLLSLGVKDGNCNRLETLIGFKIEEKWWFYCMLYL